MSSKASVTMKLAKTFQSAQQTLEDRLPSLWEELFGNNNVIIQERLDSIQENIVNLINGMVQEEEETRQLYIDQYNALSREAVTLETELSIHVPRRDVQREPLCLRIKTLEQDLEAHRKVRNERMTALSDVQKQESTICAILGEKCTYADLKTVPSESKLEEMRQHIVALTAELKSRQTSYTRLRTQILKKWSTLELEPENAFELQVENDELANLLDQENLRKLEALLGKLEDTEAKMKEELEVLRYKLSTLWNRLNTGSKERERFLTVNYRCCRATLSAFEKQIEECTALKLTRINEIVGAIRAELEDWWNRCHFGQKQREEFAEFSRKHDITEEVLEKHEKEVEKVKQYFADNRETIELLENRFSLWDEMVELEEKANDKDRLFSNRGGQLLMEEKKRKFIQKELPKLERKLDKLFDAFEAKYGHVFLYDGEDAREWISHQWEERNKSKENVKQAKKNVVSATTSRSRLLGPPVQNMTARQTPDKSGTLKRRGDATPLVESKRRLLNAATKTELQRGFSKPTPVGKIPPSARNPQPGGSSPTPSLPSYSMFQNQLDGNTALNSTYDLKSLHSSTGSMKQVTRSTPLPGKPKLPARSRLMSPKVKAKPPSSTLARSYSHAQLTPRPQNTLRRSRSYAQLTPRTNSNLTRSHAQLTPKTNSTLTRSRSQAQLTKTPKQLPFVF